MAIKTERPAGGDDHVLVYKARTPDEARKARTALLSGGLVPEYPEEAIEPFFARGPGQSLPVRVPLKDAARAIKALDEAFKRPPPPAGPVKTGEEHRQEAEAALRTEAVAEEEEPPRDGSDKAPPRAVERYADRSLYIVLLSILLPGAGVVPALFGACYAYAIRKEIASRPEEAIGGGPKAKIALIGGLVLAVLHLGALFAFFRFGPGALSG